ncbi:unnamed protein product [Moneuplotes crassus]|uniref:Uncharacterized protein n=1 Tax=Euplotes crassus TaxID=5936 RepID=A0AAD1UDP3_EUPCR|nr:unnamed protein product [Moneuplotes crassus]
METPAEGSNAPGSFDWAKKHEKEGRSDFQKYISVGYHITIIIFGFLMLLLAWLAYDSLNTYSDAIDDFQENWETIPIVDIKTSTTECPEGYESLIDREWPGTVSGCDCHQASFGYSHYKDLDTGHCSSNQTKDGCRDVHSTHKAPLDKFYGVRICGYRAGANFVQIERPFKLAGEISCPNGYKICGSGDPSHIICVNQGEQCPINDVKILMNGETPEPGYQTITLDHTLDIKLAFTSDSSGLPVVRFRLTEGQVCADPDIYMMSEGRYPYELLRNEDYHQCDKEVADGYFDTRYENIGSVNEERLLKDNGKFLFPNT